MMSGVRSSATHDLVSSRDPPGPSVVGLASIEAAPVVSAIDIQPPRDVIGERVGILMSDMVGSTELAQSLGVGWAQVVSDHHRLVRACCVAHEGFEASNQGDGFLYLFRSVTGALDAAIATRDALRREEWPGRVDLRIRIGLHVGAVGYRTDAGIIGIDIHRAARIMAAADGDQILVSAAAFDELLARRPARVTAFHDHGWFWLKDLRAPERIYEFSGDGRRRLVRALAVTHADHPPTPCRLVGREAELAQLELAIAERSGVPMTVCGIGGVGKTRLAIELLRTCRTRPGFFVDLAHLTHPTQVVSEIARHLGIERSTVCTVDDIAEDIDARGALIVLDNLEQVIVVAPTVARLARLAPRARIVVTSRVDLHVSGEVVIALLPLPTGPDAATSGTALQLFDELARELHGRALATADEQRVAADICAILDGIPLAIELAVGRLEMLGLIGLRDHLARTTSILAAGRRDAPARHQAIDTAIRWSYDLLTDDGRRAFRSLSQLPGGASAAAVGELCGLELTRALNALQELVEHRLALVADGTLGIRRFSMFRLVRDFGTAVLAAGDEAAALRSTITTRFRQLARRAAFEMQSSAQHDVYHELLDELDNIRAVLDWAADGTAQPDDALTMATDLTSFWWHRHLVEGLFWLRRLTAPGTARSRVTTRALVRAALLASYGGTADDAIALAQRGVDLCRAEDWSGSDLSLGLQVLAAAWSAAGERDAALAAVREGLLIDRKVRAETRAFHVVNHANVLLAENLTDEAESLYEESRTYFQEHGDTWLIAGPLARLGDVALRRGELDVGTALLSDALAAWRRGGGTSGQARALAGLARARLLAGHHDEAVGLAGEAFTWARETGTVGEAPWAIAVRGASLVSEDRPEDAARLFGAALGLGRAFAQPMHGCLRHDLAAPSSEVIHRLSLDTAAALMREGQGWNVDRAMAEVADRWT